VEYSLHDSCRAMPSFLSMLPSTRTVHYVNHKSWYNDLI